MIKKDPWLKQVYSKWQDADKKEIIEWLKEDRWGRCVYQCDNDVVDSQTVHLKFKKNIKATFTLTSFDTGRNIEIFGTKGTIRAGEFYKKMGADIFVTNHATEEIRKIKIDLSDIKGYDHHMGGDEGIVDKLYSFMNRHNGMKTKTSFAHAHLIAFASEESRVNNKPVSIKDFYNNNLK